MRYFDHLVVAYFFAHPSAVTSLNWTRDHTAMFGNIYSEKTNSELKAEIEIRMHFVRALGSSKNSWLSIQFTLFFKLLYGDYFVGQSDSKFSYCP